LEDALDTKVEALLKKMTLEEKVSMVSGIDFWHTQNIDRLGIPSIKVTDGPHGCRTASDTNANQTIPATCFPTGAGLAATWNTELMARVGAAVGTETLERGCTVILGPCVNIHRHPLGGRNFESYSEDPYLSSRMTVAFITGVQTEGVGTSVKHFALNNQEYERMTISSESGERAMREIYFPSFEKAVKEAKTMTVMCSYPRINGVYSSENRWLLTDLLKKEWGFEGLVMSDWFAVHSTAPSANSGLDLEMPGPALWFGEKLLKAVNNGEVPENQIDDMVGRTLGVMLRAGAMENKRTAAAKIKSAPEHEKLAREAAEESITLLKNERNVLPFKQSIKSLAVIGPNAAKASIQGGGSAGVTPFYTVPPLEALNNRLCGKVNISYELGCPSNIFTLPLNAEYLFSSEKNGQYGLLGEYFANNELSGQPAGTKVETNFKQRWMNDAPPFKGIHDDFSIRWTGIFNASATGIFKFGIATEGWCRIYIGKKMVCSNWGENTVFDFMPSSEKTGEITMEAGQSYPVKIEFCRNPANRQVMRSIRIGCNIPLPADLTERAAAAAKNADAAIIFTGLTDEYESEGFDRKTMDLPAGQTELIQKVAKANPNTIVVLNNGAPVSMSSWIDKVPAVIEAYYPGQEGGNAIANILFGDVNPSGKLPDTFPVQYEDNPALINYPGEAGKVLYGEGIYVGYRYYDAKKVEPLFPFGHGLSYTSFKYSNLKVTPAKVKPEGKITVTVDVKNTGKRPGKEVVQLYIHDVAAKVARPPQELKAFTKVSLEPGEAQTVMFALDKEALSFWEAAVKDWVAEPGEFEVLVGSSSRDIRAKKTFELTV
jgi:beta-glucosidase